MIQFNIKYDLNNGDGWIIFKSGGSGIVSAEYNRGTIQGNWDGETLKGQFIDTVSKGQGLIEFRFNENGFEAKWKAGIDEGPMKGKWMGLISSSKTIDDFNNLNDPSYNGFLKTSTNMLKGYLTNNENYELSSTDKLISELEEGDITNSMQEYFRFIEFLFDEINTGFRNVIRNDDILINTSFGQINTTFINYDDSRDKLEWVFMEMFRCREDNIDLMPEQTYEFIINEIKNRPFTSFIYYPNSDAYENFEDPDFSFDDWQLACQIYSSLVKLFKNIIFYHLKSLQLADVNKLDELKEYFGLYELME